MPSFSCKRRFRKLRILHVCRPPLATNGQSKLTQGRIAVAHGRFSRIRQVARMCNPIYRKPKWLPWQCPSSPLYPHLTHDSLGTSESITQTSSRSVQPFCTDDRRVSLYFTMGHPFPLKIAPSHGDLDPSIHPSSQPKRHVDRFRHFCMADYCRQTEILTARSTDHATRGL